MITWLQANFGKHHKRALLVLLAVLVISFVFTIGSVPRGTVSGKNGPPRMLLGVNLNDAQQVQALQESTAMALALQGRQARTGQEMEQALLGRIAILCMADQWQIPNPTEAQKKDYVQTLPLFMDSTGKFDLNKYQKFLDSLSLKDAMYRDRVAETLDQNWRLEQAVKVMSGPGYALPFSAEIQASFRGTTWNMDVASLDIANFTAKLDPTDAVLQALYNKDPSKFALPAQVHLSYAHFTAPPSTATPTAADLKEFVAADTKDFPDAKPDSLDAKTTAAATLAWQKAQGAQEAGLQAQNFVKALYDVGITRGTPAFDALLQKAGVTIAPLPPVSADKAVPADSPLPNDAMQQLAQSLNAQHFYSDPVRLPDGAAVVFYEGATPASTPSFADARAAVLATYTETEKAKQFEAKAKELQAVLSKTVALGQNFKTAATALGLTVKNFPSVNFTDPPLDLSYPVLAALAEPDARGVPLILTLKPGTVSPMLPTEDGATFVELNSRDTPKLTTESAETQKSLKTMQSQEAELSAAAIIDPIIAKAMRALESNSGS